jgi:hypothetical protein
MHDQPRDRSEAGNVYKNLQGDDNAVRQNSDLAGAKAPFF